MIITMKKSASKEQIESVMKRLEHQGLTIHSSIGENYNDFGIVGDPSKIDPKQI